MALGVTGLDDLYAAGLGSFLAVDDFVLNLGAILQDSAIRVVGMDKHVFSAAIWRDEPKTLTRIEELNRTLLHRFFLFQLPDDLNTKPRFGTECTRRWFAVVLRMMAPCFTVAVTGANAAMR
jgi:hypothetical protein